MAYVLNMVGGGGGSSYAAIGVKYPAGKICECSNGVDTLQAKVESYKGDIVTFQAEEEVPLRDLDVDITAQQDLHGYDSPWPAGGGKNKCSLADQTFEQYKEVEVDEIPAGSYIYSAVITSTDTDASQSSVVFLDSGKTTLATKAIDRSVGGSRVSTSFTVSSPIKYIRLYAATSYPSGAGDTATFTDNMVCLSTESDPTVYAPYSNICPISGWSEAKVTRRGKNLIKVTADTIANSQNCTFVLADSGLTLTATGQYARRMDSFAVEIGKTYTLSFRGSSTGNFRAVYICKSETYNSSGRYAAKTLTGTDDIYTYTFTAETNVLALGWYCTSDSNTGAMTISNLQLEEGSLATPFEAYQSNTYTIDLNGTRYGGTLDVLTGVLTINRVKRVLNDSSKWITATGIVNFFVYDNNFADRKIYSDSYTGLSCSYIQINSQDSNNTGRWSSASSKTFGIRSNVLTLEQIQTDAIAGNIEISYELATPTTVQLTAQQVDTLVGRNVIYADAGDVAVEYTSGYWIFPIKANGTWTVTCDIDSEAVVITHKGQVAFVDFVGSGYITSIGYSGNTSVIENDDKVWEVALLTSGTLNVYKPIAVDIFLCGGGGGGGRGGYGGGLGGGGGYTKNLFNIILAKGTYAVAIGDGGEGGTGSGASGDGGASSITGVDGASANGGSGVAAGGSGAGGNGGSGGGGGTSNTKGAGGSNGNGGAGGSTGQEMSTYAYLDSTDTLYAGGGGGGTRLTDGSAGGTGGGADGGGINDTGSSAAMNTGGGGGGGGGKDSSPYMAGGNGGSGIIRIRTHR